jgi:hypothetical protein
MFPCTHMDVVRQPPQCELNQLLVMGAVLGGKTSVPLHHDREHTPPMIPHPYWVVGAGAHSSARYLAI